MNSALIALEAQVRAALADTLTVEGSDTGATTGVTGLGTATHASIWDASSGGNMLDYGSLTPTLAMDDRADLRVEAGQWTITET